MNKKGQLTPKRGFGIFLLFGGLYLIATDQTIAGILFAAGGFALIIAK